MDAGSTRYTVVIQPPAERDVDAICEFLRKRSEETARRFLRGLLDAMASLEELPRRCPVIPEQAAVDREVRHLRYARHRIIFWIDGRLVRVVHVRHGSRRPLRRGDIDWDP